VCLLHESKMAEFLYKDQDSGKALKFVLNNRSLVIIRDSLRKGCHHLLFSVIIFVVLFMKDKRLYKDYNTQVCRNISCHRRVYRRTDFVGLTREITYLKGVTVMNEYSDDCSSGQKQRQMKEREDTVSVKI
jgi:hypothetical protein